MQTNLEH